MGFSISDTVVYPHHGAAEIGNVIKREFNGETVQYPVLQILQSDSSIQVPAEDAELVGTRNVAGEKGLLKVFSILREIDVEGVGNQPCRYKASQERLGSGDINKVAKVVHDLRRRDQNRGLSASKGRILGKTRQVLVGEFAFADGVDEARVEEAFTRVSATIERRRALAQEGAVSEKKNKTDDEPVDLDADTQVVPPSPVSFSRDFLYFPG